MHSLELQFSRVTMSNQSLCLDTHLVSAADSEKYAAKSASQINESDVDEVRDRHAKVHA